MIKSLLNGTLVILGFKVLSAICSLLSNVLISRALGPSGYGEYSLYFTIINVGMVINLLGLDLYIIKKVNEFRDDELILSFLIKAFFILVKLGGVISVSFWIGSNLFNQRVSPTNFGNHIFLAGIAIFLFSLIKFINSIFRAHENIIYFSILDGLVIQLPLFLVFGFYFVNNVDDYDPIVILNYILFFSAIFSLISVYVYLLKKYDRFKFKKRYTKAILKFSYPMMLTSSIIYFMSYLDNIFISKFLSNYHVGLYSAIVKLSIPLTFITSSISGLISPKIAKAYHHNAFDEIKKLYSTTFKMLFLSGIFLISVFMIFNQEILGFFGEAYKAEFTTYFTYMVSAFVSGSLFGPIGYFLILTGLQKQFLKIIITALILNILLNILLIPSLGINGAAVAILVSTLLWKVWGYILLKKRGIL